MNSRTTRNRATTITSREELENVLGRYAAAIIERDAVKAEMESRITEIRAGYEERSAALDRRLDLLFSDIECYLANNPGEIPAGRKSLELLHGTGTHILRIQVCGNPGAAGHVRVAVGAKDLEAASKWRFAYAVLADGKEFRSRRRGRLAFAEFAAAAKAAHERAEADRAMALQLARPKQLGG